MSRPVAALFVLAAVALWAQDPAEKPPESQDKKTLEMKRDRPAQKTSEKEEVPPEEDTDLSTQTFTFNPLQSQRDVGVGDLYRKKGNLVAAARRYTTATKYNENNTEAWLKLGEVKQKLKDADAARAAYSKYLELDPSSKKAQEVRKTLAKLK